MVQVTVLMGIFDHSFCPDPRKSVHEKYRIVVCYLAMMRHYRSNSHSHSPYHSYAKNTSKITITDFP